MGNSKFVRMLSALLMILALLLPAAPTVGVIGLGYVGLSYAVAFAAVGCTVVGCDVLPSRVATINRGESPLPDILPDTAVADPPSF